MALPNQTGRSRFTILLLILTSITVLTLDFRGFGPLASVQGAVKRAFEPLTSASGTLFDPLVDGWESLTEYGDLKDENARLRAELDELRGTQLQGQAAEATLQEVLAELDIDYLGGAERVTGQVIDRVGNFEDFTIELDKGSKAGIEVGMPAVTSAGLVGRVTQVEIDSSRIRILSEPGFTVGIKVLGPGDVALARGVGESGNLEVRQGIADETVVEAGMVVVTSGIEGSPFPPDILVGVISSVEIDPTELTQTLEIVPLADLDSLSFVTVVLWSVDS